MIIHDNKNWVVEMAPLDNYLLGSFIIKNKKNIKYMHEIDSESWVELLNITKELERVLVKLFNATCFNFVSLMDINYINDEDLTFALIPRYKRDVALFSIKYKDKKFGKDIYNKKLVNPNKKLFDEEEIDLIYNILKKEVNL